MLDKLKLDKCKIPHDVVTQWNSTFDMLAFALQYRVAIDNIAGNKTVGICKYKLSDEEWWITEQLHDMLKEYGCSYFFLVS